MSIAYQIRTKPAYRRSKPVRSPRYLAFIRKQASVVSGLGPCEACHTGAHGAGQKSSDLAAIPLTRKEHEAFDRDPHFFAAFHRLDIPELILHFNQLYAANGGDEC